MSRTPDGKPRRRRARDVPVRYVPVRRRVAYRSGIALPHTPRYVFGVTAFVAAAALLLATYLGVTRVQRQHDNAAALRHVVVATVTARQAHAAQVSLRSGNVDHRDVYVFLGSDYPSVQKGSTLKVVPNSAEPTLASVYAPATGPGGELATIIGAVAVAVALAVWLVFYRRRRIDDGRWNEREVVNSAD